MDYSGPRNTDILNLKGKIKLNETIIENLVENFLLKKFDNSAPIPDCHREWWKMVTSDSKFVAIGAPRGHAKSTAITFSYTLASILFHAHKFIIILSDTEAQAILFLGDIKKELIENEELVALFGIKGLIKDSDSDFIIEFNDGFQARVIAKGSNQRLRGLKWDGARPDLVIGDDLENEDIVLNADRREKFSKWFTGAVIPLLSKDGKIRVPAALPALGPIGPGVVLGRRLETVLDQPLEGRLGHLRRLRRDGSGRCAGVHRRIQMANAFAFMAGESRPRRAEAGPSWPTLRRPNRRSTAPCDRAASGCARARAVPVRAAG